MNEKSSCPVLRGRDSGNTVLLLDDLSDADLRRANLSGADLNGVDLSGANLSRAIMPDGEIHP